MPNYSSHSCSDHVHNIMLFLLGLTFCLHFASCQYNVYRQDPFAILSRTLLTYQQAACDGQVLDLVCPSGTKISIQLVQYGRTAPSSQVCPPTSEYPRVLAENDEESFQTCVFPEALKIVEEKCHGQEACQMVTAPEVFGSGLPSYAGGDPCPRVRKYVEVAYKCKPTVFKSKVVCQDKDLKLQCGSSETENNDTRIAIYSSSFSASGGTHIYCPSEGKKDFDSAFDQQACEEQYVTEPVMKLCHGQRSCSVLANGTSLGAPDCKPHHNIYLKTVYTCIHKSVLKPQYVDQPEITTVSTTTTTRTTTMMVSSTTSSSTTRPPKLVTAMTGKGPVPNPGFTVYPPSEHDVKQMKPAEKMLDDDIVNTQDDQILIGSDFDFGAEKKKKQQQAESETNFVLGFVRDFFAFNQHFKENKEKFILFISLTVAAGLSIFLAMFLWNMYRTNRLDRIAKSLRQPNLSQSTLCSATGSVSANGTTPGGLRDHAHNSHQIQNSRRESEQRRAASIDSGSINAYGPMASSSHGLPGLGLGGQGQTSPAHSPNNCPPGAIDIELEIGDHEVDTMFRDPGPKPIIVARSTPPLQDVSGPFLYGTLNRRPQMTLPRPRSDRLGSETSSITNHIDLPVMTSSISAYNNNTGMSGQDIWTPMAVHHSHPGHGAQCGGGYQMPGTVGNGGPGNGSVASSLRSESPISSAVPVTLAMSPIQQLDQYQLQLEKNPRYSTIGRPGRGLHHHLHHNNMSSTSTASPVRSVMIVAPGDPIPPNLGPQQQLQLQQMSSDHHPIRPPSEALNNYYG